MSKCTNSKCRCCSYKPEFKLEKPETWPKWVRITAGILFPATLAIFLSIIALFLAYVSFCLLTWPFRHLMRYVIHILILGDRKGYDEWCKNIPYIFRE